MSKLGRRQFLSALGFGPQVHYLYASAGAGHFGH
jgi:hypothetical protein